MSYETFLEKLLTGDERYLILTAENRGPMRGLPDRMPGRFLDFGIAEQTMVGQAAGLALRGRIPLVHAMGTFLTMRAFEFIRTDVGLGNLPVKLIGTMAGFLSDANGPTHQAVEDISLMRGIPNIHIFAPMDEADLLAGLPGVFNDPAPWYIRFNNRPAKVEHAELQHGKAESFGNGTDVALLSYGFLVEEALEAQKILAQSDIKARVLNLRFLKPLDEAAVLAAITECRLVVTLEDHFQIGGLYSILAELLLHKQMTAPVLPIALNERWFKPALLPDVLEYEGFSGAKVAERIRKRLEA